VRFRQLRGAALAAPVQVTLELALSPGVLRTVVAYKVTLVEELIARAFGDDARMAALLTSSCAKWIMP